MDSPAPELLHCVTEDGWTLQLRRHAAAGEARAAVLCLHAMMVDGRTFERRGEGLAATLGARGLLPLVADLRGRGGSGPPVERGGRWSYEGFAHQDLPALFAAAREAAPGLPLFVVGHSLGGHLAIAAVTRDPSLAPAGFVLLSTNIWLPSLDRHPLRRLERHAQMAVFDAVGVALDHFPSRRLKMGPIDEAAPYVNDLARFWWEDRWGSAPGEDYLQAARAIEAPALCVFGRGDRLMAHEAGGRAWAARIGKEGAEVWLEGRASGLPFDPGHMEVLTDPRARPLWERLASWILQRCEAPGRAPSPGRAGA
ncbi:MAG: alpha/beta fold hydrolase [Deltaproteobacteria bacterium]|nr:alpha/beta fold hydrolase [Deltaproteobacteria bacterium]